jgi:hypothetical protein
VSMKDEQERVNEAAMSLFNHTSRDPADEHWVKVRPHNLDELREALIALKNSQVDHD